MKNQSNRKGSNKIETKAIKERKEKKGKKGKGNKMRY